jgi:major inositol transporter-like SP family MFS transporter
VVTARFILGLAVGAASASVPVYISEMSPAKSRGRMVTINELMIVTGQLLAYTVNAIINHSTGGADITWRIMIVAGTIPAVFFWIGVLRIPETPRWYIAHNMPKMARKVLEQIRDAKDFQAEFLDIQRVVEEAKHEKGSLKDLGVPWMRRLFLIGVIIAISQQITGVDTIMYYSPTILKTAGLGTGDALTATILNGVISVLATFLGIWQLGKRKRRTMLITGQLGIVASLALIGTTFVLFTHNVVDASNNVIFDDSGNPEIAPNFPFASYIILIFMLCFLVFQQGFVSPVTWLMLSEIFPIKIRGLSMGLSTAILWSSKFCIVFAFPILLAKLGGSFTFYAMSFLNIVVVTLVIKFVPETSGRTLESLENEFRAKYDK